jgi:hypothetical protein
MPGCPEELPPTTSANTEKYTFYFVIFLPVALSVLLEVPFRRRSLPVLFFMIILVAVTFPPFVVGGACFRRRSLHRRCYHLYLQLQLVIQLHRQNRSGKQQLNK